MVLPTSIDYNDMKNLVNHFPELLTSFKLSNQIIEELKNYVDEGVEGICFLGMGGSSISGNYVRALMRDTANKQIVVVRDYSIPAFVTDRWVVIAVSYSGNTAETLSALSTAIAIGARVITITSGGKMSEEKDHPQILIPQGIQPRAALPLMFSITLPVVEILTLQPLSDFEHLAKVLSQKESVWNETIGSPRALATSFMNQIPLFIGAQHLIPVAYRAKCQINENAKALAFHSELPEANHNEIESFASTHGCKVMPIFLRSSYESEALTRKFQATEEIYKGLSLNAVSLAIEGKTKLEEMLSLTHFLDTVSVEYAELLGADPVSVERITDLKRRLSKS